MDRWHTLQAHPCARSESGCSRGVLIGTAPDTLAGMPSQLLKELRVRISLLVVLPGCRRGTGTVSCGSSQLVFLQ